MDQRTSNIQVNKENTNNTYLFFLVFSYGTIFPMVAPEAEWVEEFQDITDEDVEATFSRQHDFWNKLEEEWKDMAEKNKETGEHPWLDDFEEVCKHFI